MDIEIIERLPNINTTNKFLILKSSYNQLKNDWLDFIEFYIVTEMRYKNYTPNQNIFKDYKLGSKQFLNFSNPINQLFGFNKGLKIIEFKYTKGIYIINLTSNYEKLVYEYIQNNKKLAGKYLTARGLIARFFLYQRMNHKLLFPAYQEGLTSLKINFDIFLKDFELYNNFIKSIIKDIGEKYLNENIKKAILILLSTTWNKLDEIKSDDINQYQKLCDNNQNIDSGLRRKITILNMLRDYLKLQGRVDISSSNSFLNSKRKNTQKNVYEMKNPFAWLQIDSNHNIYPLKIKALQYLEKLKETSASLATQKKHMVAINHLFRYLLDITNNMIIDKKFIEKLFDPKSDLNISKHILKIKSTIHYKKEIIMPIAKFLKYSELMSDFSLNHIPKFKGKRRKITPRNAMPKEMLQELKNILLTNPPSTNILWNPNKADISWWPHKEIYPALPIMMLIHLNIPLRGGQLRHLCRNQSLIFNHETGELDRFIINTDKNVERETLQEIPNVWNELNILKDYLAWNKEYFPDIEPYVYNNDPNTPWINIEALFLTPKTPEPISRNVHKIYLNKLLCIYQVRMDIKYKNGEIKHPIKIAWKKDGSEFFKSENEVNLACDTYLSSQIKTSYNIHSIRVTGITRYLEAGLNLNIIQMLTGHVNLDMIVTVYTKFTHDEKKNMLKSAVNKLEFSNNETILENVSNFIYDEIPNNYNISDKKDMKKAFKENGLFSLPRNAFSSNDINMEMELGTDIAHLQHPSLWTPMIHGICPGVICPEGRERRCCLCPYFITGKLFLNGLQHMANASIIKFHRLAQEFREEKKVDNRFVDSKSSVMELQMEEILGWSEILDKVEQSINNNCHIDTNNKNLSLLSQHKQIGLESKNIDLAYLEHCYNAKLMGVEQDHFGLKVLTIKAIKLATKMDDTNQINSLISDENIAIDYLMKYHDEYKRNNLLSEFVEQLQLSK